MISAIKTGHSAIIIEFQDVDDKVKGPGFWKLNCSLLNDKQYVDEINCLLPSWLQEGKRELSDQRSVWDWVKYNVKKYSRQYSMTKSQQRKAEEWQLNREFQEASSVFQKNPSQENLSALNVLKEKMEQMYDKKVEGIIVRPQARWHEHGALAWGQIKYFVLRRRTGDEFGTLGYLGEFHGCFPPPFLRPLSSRKNGNGNYRN